jgi:alpha-L-fucosidase 2
MRKIQCSLIVLAVFCTLTQAFNVSTYNQTWTSQSSDVQGSMPIGNGETGCNVWVQNNVIHFLVGRTDAWNDVTDNGWVELMLPKLAKIDVTITPNPFSSGFSQVLKLKEGEIEIIGGTGASQKDIIIYVDANASVLRIEGHGSQAFTMAVSVDQSYGTSVSRTVSVSNNAVVFYHRNPSSSYIWNQTTSTQKVDKTHFTDPMSNRTFGGVIQGTGFTASGSTATSGNDTVAVCEIFTYTSLAASVAAWTTDIQNIITAAHATSVSQARAAHEKWWNNFWGRSWIELDNTRTETTKNYLLQRYVNACEGRGAYPAKFNGSLFNFTDNRTWGGTYWMQNTRHLFWLNLESGDFDLMNPFFKMYVDMIPIRKEATKALFNHDGMNVPETVHFFGLWANSDYGDGINTISGWVGLHYNGSLELLAMMLDYYDYTKDNAFATQKMIPYAREVLRFWDVHWPRANGKLNITANALETYRKVTNPSCDVAGLQWDLDKLIK